MMDKTEILTDMRIHPTRYSREDVSEYINSGMLTREDLVTNSRILTDSAFNHIKRFPHLCMEQHVLPVSLLERPISKTGNTDVYFFGIPGSGRSCLIAGLMSLVGQIGFQFNPLGPGGGGKYAEDLRNYARNNMLPPATDQNFIQVIDAKINDEKNNSKKIAFIELPGENLIKCVKKNLLACIDDLGLPSGTKWATCNVGANSPELYGKYYAWGETSTKYKYTHENSKYYRISNKILKSDGVLDNIGNLTSGYDPATMQWESPWRMPTLKEMEELDTKCTWTWTTQNGTSGFKVTGLNGNSIFLPASGWYNSASDGAISCQGEKSGYWTSTVVDGDNDARCLFFMKPNTHYANMGHSTQRSRGLCIRHVCK